MLPQEAIEQFKELYLKRYGVKLSNEEASYRANNLFNLYKITYMGEPCIEKIKPKTTNNYAPKSNNHK
jgi:hypothetical protein